MERVRREEAVGRRLAHDVTQVVPGEVKRVLLHRGETVRPEHMETLADMGKEHLLVLTAEEEDAEAGDGSVHENDAAALVAEAASGPGLAAGTAVEGKCDVRARADGLFLADAAAVDAFNVAHMGRAALITRPHGTPVKAGERVATARIFPARVTADEARLLAAAPSPLRLSPFRPLRAAAVITGAEVAAGRVPDAFGPLLAAKLSAYGSTLARTLVVGDDAGAIAAALVALRAEGYDLLFATGGMAVDEDDVTQAAIRRAGAQVRFAGVPMQPATLLLFATLDGTPLFGVPAGVLYDPYTALDRLLPFVLAGHLPQAEEVARMGVGGLMAAAGHGHGGASARGHGA
ncbi:MAG: molybdopterin-binding protein [Firmicutes bacterium]|nr:molybdopterin-binding protein [Bacillota bacterium]